MLKNETVKIDGHTYFAIQLLPHAALHLGLRVGKVLGSVSSGIAGMISKVQKNAAATGEAGTLSDDEAIESLGMMLGKIDPAEVTSLIEELVKHAKKDGNKITSLDTDFYSVEEGVQLMSAIKVAFFVLKLNYGGLLSKLGKSVAAPEKAPE